MKVFFITHTFGGMGGSELYVKDMLTELSRRGVDVFVFAPKSYPDATEHSFGIKGAFLTPTFGHFAFHKFEYLLYYGKAIECARNFKADVIHTHNSSFPGVIAHQVKKALGIPFILCVEGLAENPRGIHQKVVIPFEKFWFPRLDFDVCVAWHQRLIEKFLKPWGVDPGKTMVIPGGVNTDNFSPKADGREFARKYGKNIISTARSLNFTNGQRILHIVNAMKIVAKKHPEFKFLIFGHGEARPAIAQRIKDLKLEDNVLLCDPLKPEDVPRMYAASSIVPFVFKYGPVTSSGLMEAMACGKAVVVPKVAEKWAKDSGVIVEETEQGIAEGIIRLIENPALRKRLGKRAREIALEEFSIKSIADRYIRLYEKLVAENKKAKKRAGI